MDDQQLERKIKESFSKIEASEALKRQTKAFLSERAFSSAHTARSRRRLVPVLACAAVLFLAVLAYPVYFYPPVSSAWISTPRWSLALTALTAWCPSPP